MKRLLRHRGEWGRGGGGGGGGGGAGVLGSGVHRVGWRGENWESGGGGAGGMKGGSAQPSACFGTWLH